jgi:hypothetical protein
MAKRKYTKAKVKIEYRKMAKIIAFLAKDRLEHPDSLVTMSPKQLFEIDTKIRNAFNRVK